MCIDSELVHVLCYFILYHCLAIETNFYNFLIQPYTVIISRLIFILFDVGNNFICLSCWLVFYFPITFVLRHNSGWLFLFFTYLSVAKL